MNFQKEDMMWIAIWILSIALAFVFDSQIISFVQSIQHPALTFFFSAVSYTMDLSWGLAVIILMIGFLTQRKVFFDAMIALLASLIVAFLLKNAVPRTRPDGLLQSFPSGHAARAFSLSHYLFKVYNNHIFCVFAILVGLSRVYLLEHFLSDVLVGAFIGIVIARIVYDLQIGEKIQKLLKF